MEPSTDLLNVRYFLMLKSEKLAIILLVVIISANCAMSIYSAWDRHTRKGDAVENMHTSFDLGGDVRYRLHLGSHCSSH